jgi:hypothetical protein
MAVMKCQVRPRREKYDRLRIVGVCFLLLAAYVGYGL